MSHDVRAGLENGETAMKFILKSVGGQGQGCCSVIGYD